MRAEDNPRIARLLDAPVFDRELAIDIARRAVWEAWGRKGYWDVLETAWRVNRTLAPGQKPMRVVGLSASWDGPSLDLVGIGGDRKLAVPWWEKLRLVRLIDDIPILLMTDGIYARNVERQIFETGDRGVVLVGAGHTTLRPHDAVLLYGRRMGRMLYERYSDRMFQVILHSRGLCGPGLAMAVEQASTRVGKTTLGFTVAGSPWSNLRDGQG